MNQQAYQGDILVVDDTAANLRLLSTFLNQQGFKVRSVISGQMAITAALTSPPDLILLDINMPGMNGYAVAERLKTEPTTKEIPIIFISALNEAMDKVKAFSVGGVDYITKPFQFEEVLARVKTHLMLRRLQKNLISSNDLLEEKVRERTAELAALNKAYERFVPREFLGHLGKDSVTKIGLGDQVQKEMTVMFADIRNFTTISEGLSPQENINFLNTYLGKIGPVIRKHHGFIDKYIGDGVMAVFPRQPEDAINAVIEIKRELQVLNQSSGKLPIRIGAGIHTGQMMIGIIGEAERLQSTVIADAVNLASRLEDLTKRYGVSMIVSSETLDRIQNQQAYNYRCVDTVQVKGKQTAVRVFEIFDGDLQQDIQLKLTTKTNFEDGLDLYHQRKFAEASVKFNQVMEASPDDRTARLYLERAARYMVQGVPAEWKGIETLIE